LGEFAQLVFSGVQPTGNLHLGNYLGAIRRFVALQETHDCIYCVVDLHAITATLHQPDLPAQTREVTAAFLAAGIDPERHIVFNQHLELTRDIAIKFNNDFAEPIAARGHEDGYFPVTEPLIGGPAARVMSLRDGTKKMSKSDPSDYSRINLTDDADAIAQKVRKAKTDPEPLPSEEAGLAKRPEADNLVGIYAALSDREPADILREFGGAQFSTFKSSLVDLAVDRLAPIAGEMSRLLADPAHIDRVLAGGAERAGAIAARTVADVKDIVGLIRS
jgi:tryptophanyl-tRNA synthetase